jgi:hypothetical protein
MTSSTWRSGWPRTRTQRSRNRRALDEHPVVARNIVEGARKDILAVASRALTTTGRKVKVEQAEKVVSLLANKARQYIYTGEVAAVNQVLWCDALVASLGPHRK